MKTNFFLFLLMLFGLVGCSGADGSIVDDHDDHDDHAHESDELPSFEPLGLSGRHLNVVATTSLVGDVVGNIGGGAIELTTLIGPNQDTHSYEATPADLVALEQADIIFVNGWEIEGQLAETIEDNYGDKFVSLSTGIEPLVGGDDVGGDDDGHQHGAVDPHVWFSIDNVKIWAANSAEILSQLEPATQPSFEANHDAYVAELDVLAEEADALLADLPIEQRKLVTNHAAFGYFAAEYDFELIGTVIPAFSTSAEPSARDLATLIEAMKTEDVCTLFAETSSSRTLAETVGAELDHCADVQVLSLYTEAIGEGETGSYIGMFRYNVQTIVQGLQP